MRQLFYATEFHSNVVVDDQELKEAFKLAGRRVNMQFLNLPDIEIVDKIKQLDSSGVLLIQYIKFCGEEMLQLEK